jgi:hypothetical protein
METLRTHPRRFRDLLLPSQTPQMECPARNAYAAPASWIEGSPHLPSRCLATVSSRRRLRGWVEMSANLPGRATSQWTAARPHEHGDRAAPGRGANIAPPLAQENGDSVHPFASSGRAFESSGRVSASGHNSGQFGSDTDPDSAGHELIVEVTPRLDPFLATAESMVRRRPALAAVAAENIAMGRTTRSIHRQARGNSVTPPNYRNLPVNDRGQSHVGARHDNGSRSARRTTGIA